MLGPVEKEKGVLVLKMQKGSGENVALTNIEEEFGKKKKEKR